MKQRFRYCPENAMIRRQRLAAWLGDNFAVWPIWAADLSVTFRVDNPSYPYGGEVYGARDQ